MNPFKLSPTDETPLVVLDKSEGRFEFSGKSLPEDVTTFYDPIIEWIEQYAAAPNTITIFQFKMIYFNTASSKLIMDILLKLEEMVEMGNGVKVEWYYREDDEDMMEAGEEFSEMAEVDFSLISSANF